MVPDFGAFHIESLGVAGETAGKTKPNCLIGEKAETNTTVMVKDGVTVLIGGLVREEVRESIRGIPILSRIPILGMLFRSKTSQKVKSELAILITPHIIDGGITTPEAQEKAATEVFKK